MRKLELLAPAKNVDFGREAVNHGADALYVGAPAFGARSGATNTLSDIETLVNYAHLYGVKVYATVNTILFDDEIEPAVRMIRELYGMGVDALIVQDTGLLECDLPPIELHASTQCHNASLERIKFLSNAGFSRIILARETSLEQMREISNSVDVELEAFVHGALCVSYSGQCYMSQYLVGRSGNRGCCSQPCRSSYDLYTGDGRLLMKERHLLSLKDFDASRHVATMAENGITSFKIEGRLKDMSYVKNVVAHYRMLLDGMMGDAFGRSSSGRCEFFFVPDVEKTFNRGYTDYFLEKRQKMASFATQKSLGKYVGEVSAVGRNTIKVDGDTVFNNGDGLCFFDRDGVLQGFLVNGVRGNEIKPNRMPNIEKGMRLRRNNDFEFEKLLSGRTAERKIGVRITLETEEGGFVVRVEDEDGLSVSHSARTEIMEESGNAEAVSAMIVKQLKKTGDTPFRVVAAEDKTGGRYFVPTSVVNGWRRDTLEELSALRRTHFRAGGSKRVDAAGCYPERELSYKGNVVNGKSEAFYRRHGVEEIERGLEETGDYGGKALMTTKYCLRYELGWCLKTKKGANYPNETLYLHNNGHRFRLEFDCSKCVMRILASNEKG